MPETYSAHESRIYYVPETTYGQTPASPSMLSVPAESLEPSVNPNNIKLRGVGSIDLQAVKKGLRAPSLKIVYPLPSDAPIDFLQYVKSELGKSLSVQVLYYKGVFAAATDIISLLYVGCKFQRATVECNVEDVVKASVELLGQDLTAGTAKLSGASYADYDGAVPFYESYVKKGSAVLERVTDWKFSIENNLKQVPVIRNPNGHLLKYLPHRHRDLTGEVVFEFESKEEFDDVVNDAEFSLEFGLGGTSKAVFTGCKWETTASPTHIEELVSLKATFVAKTVAIS
ncbi:MAG: phage tail tube protein [Candidatus Bathyarchaeota archaeon]|nr:phage tail tube protein [Candidatus Bathyarchaeota archaeon]